MHASSTRVAVYGASSLRTHQVITALRGWCSAELRDPAVFSAMSRGVLPHAGAECAVLVLDPKSDRAAVERALRRGDGIESVPLLIVASSATDDVAPWPAPALRTTWLSSAASSIELRQAVERVVRLVPLRRAGAAIAAARHLPPLLRRALVFLCADPLGVASVRLLGDRLNCNRSTLWHHWRALWDEPDPPRLQDFVDWVLLYRASATVSPTRSWAMAAARGACVHEDTLARMARRLVGWRLRDLGRDDAALVVLEKFHQKILSPLLEDDATLRRIMRRSAVDLAGDDSHHTAAIRATPNRQAPMAS